MKSLVTVLIAVLLVNMLAAAGFVGWLYHSERLNEDRVKRVVALFKPTVAQEKIAIAEAEAAAAEAHKKAEELARLTEVSAGPVTMSDRLAADRRSTEIADLKMDRVQREIQDLRRRLETAQREVLEQKQKLDDARKGFDVDRKKFQEQQKDEDFRRLVNTFQQLKPRQAKELMVQLLVEGKRAQVVEYLAAMQLRSAAAIIEQFKSPEEIAVAGQLLEELRQRGVHVGMNEPKKS